MSIYKLPAPYTEHCQVARAEESRPPSGSRPLLVHTATAHARAPAPLPSRLPAGDSHHRLNAHFLDEVGRPQVMSLTSSWAPAANDPSQRFRRMASFFAAEGCTLLELRQTTQVEIEL